MEAEAYSGDDTRSWQALGST